MMPSPLPWQHSGFRHENESVRRPVTAAMIPLPSKDEIYNAPLNSDYLHGIQDNQAVKEGIASIANGTVMAYCPSSGRRPALWRIQYKGTSFTEDLVEDELMQAISAASKRAATALPSSTLQTIADIQSNYEVTMRERRMEGCETYIAHHILYKLVIVACLELEREARLRDKYETLRKAMAAQQQKQGQKNGTINDSTPKYYHHHPTTYMGGTYVPPHEKAAQEEDEEETPSTSLPPSQLAHRVRQACGLAYNQYCGTAVSNRRSTRRQNQNDDISREPGGKIALLLLQEISRMDDDCNKMAVDAEEDEEGEEDDKHLINPYFRPSGMFVLEHLARRQKSLTASDIQVAICYALDDGIQLKDANVEEDHANSNHHVCLECTTGDKLSQMEAMDPTEFSRCRFTSKYYVEQTEGDDDQSDQEIEESNETSLTEEQVEQQRLAQIEANKRGEREWKQKKQFYTWRYRSIVGNGCTIWPSWNKYVTEKLAENKGDEALNVEADAVKSETLQGEHSSNAVVADSNNIQMQSDAILAQTINSTAIATTRRSRRATNNDSDAIVFYGKSNQTNISATQLLATIYRLVAKSHPGFLTLLDLKRLVLEESYDSGYSNDMKRLRLALGKLMFKLNKIQRNLVNSSSDLICWNKLLSSNNGDKTKKQFLTTIETNIESNLVMKPIPKEEQTESVPSVVTSETIQKGHENEITKLRELQNYILSLHLTELTLRALILKQNKKARHGFQITPDILAKAADEREGDIDATDGKAFLEKEDDEEDGSDNDDNVEKIEWITSPDHPLLGKTFYRPDKCSWYKVVSYTPSIPAPNGSTNQIPNLVGQDNTLRENTIVERRIRFRAIPMTENDEGDDEDENFIVLTEGQVNAGLHAAELLHSKEVVLSAESSESDHPFYGMTGLRVSLEPAQKDSKNDEKFICGTIVGFDTVACSIATEFRVLILLDEPEEKAGIELNGKKNNKTSAIWAKLSSDGSTIEPIDDTHCNFAKSYKMEPQEYHPFSPAYQACEEIVEFLKNHAKSEPFMEPVDPIALNIPDYFDVIKNPMDILTVEKNLKEGKYGRIPPSAQRDVSTVRKMIQGPFYDDVMLIFDNAMVFNPSKDWIHIDALQLKRIICKKIETIATKADSEDGFFQKERSNVSRKKSVYVDEDSDVDMYEYETDVDDDDYDESTRTKKRKRNGQVGKFKGEDYSTQAVEAPFRMPSNFVGGIFSDLPIYNDAASFGLPPQWSCRHARSVTELDDNSNKYNCNEDEDIRENELKQIELELNQGGLIRRSSRSAPSSVSRRKKSDSGKFNTSGMGEQLKNVEYYHLMHNKSIDWPDNIIPEYASNRIEVERIREILHEEYYAKQYSKFFVDSTRKTSIKSFDGEIDELEKGYGSFSESSFPPFLGRIVPTEINLAGRQDMLYSGQLRWEIRSQYVMPALRWIMKGLIQSGHFVDINWPSNKNSDISLVLGETTLLTNNCYFYDKQRLPFDIIDVKELQKRKRSENYESSEEEEEELELSAYEKMRAERVARNKERLKTLGLA